MSKKRKSSTSVQKTGDGFIGRLFAQTKLPAHVTEEQDWYLDTPDVRLTRVFTVVLILHVVAVGGILAFKMVEKASNTAPAVVAETGEGSSASEATPASTGESNAAAAPAAAGTTTDPEPAPVTAPATGSESQGGAESLLVDHPSAKEYQEYRVGSGESLISIAKKLGVSASEIREINHLDSGGNLAVGRWIKVPKPTKAPEPAPAPAVAAVPNPVPAKPAPVVAKPPAPAAPSPAPASSPAAVAAPTQDTYQVQKGDTLFGIARQFGIKYQDLMAANNIDKPESLQAGQTLKVPKP